MEPPALACRHAGLVLCFGLVQACATPKAEEPRPGQSAHSASGHQPSAVSASAATTPGHPETVPSSVAPAPNASAARPWPGVACTDAGALPNLRHIACAAECDAGLGSSCETLGDLQSVEEGLPFPESSAGHAARSYGTACSLGVVAACDKRVALLHALSESCRKQPARGCVIEGDAMLELEGDDQREKADASYSKACRHGSAVGCFQRGELHSSWGPEDVHQRLSVESYARACQLGYSGGCCALEQYYLSRGNQRAAAHVRRQAERGRLGMGCGGGSLAPAPRERARGQ